MIRAEKAFVYFLIVYVVLFLLVTALLIGTGHASTTKARPNSLGVDQVYENNNAYLLALPIDGTNLEGNSLIRFRPYNTPALYDETVLFCGSVNDYFHNADGTHMSGVLVIVYDKVGHRMYRGLACHDMIHVFPMAVQSGK